MRDIKDSRIEISGEGDIELLDYALREWGFGKVERDFRLWNIKRWENIQFSLTRKGKRQVWQPFRAAFSRTAAGTYPVSSSRDYFCEELIKKAGFTVVKIEPGTWPDSNVRPTGVKMNFSVTLNGRNLTLSIG
jgi:hypothetical protein